MTLTEEISTLFYEISAIDKQLDRMPRGTAYDELLRQRTALSERRRALIIERDERKKRRTALQFAAENPVIEFSTAKTMTRAETEAKNQRQRGKFAREIAEFSQAVNIIAKARQDG